MDREVGIEAIVFMQALAGIREPRGVAERAWDSFTPEQKRQTLMAFECLSSVDKNKARRLAEMFTRECGMPAAKETWVHGNEEVEILHVCYAQDICRHEEQSVVVRYLAPHKRLGEVHVYTFVLFIREWRRK
jgi:hypothetical protein